MLLLRTFSHERSFSIPIAKFSHSKVLLYTVYHNLLNLTTGGDEPTTKSLSEIVEQQKEIVSLLKTSDKYFVMNYPDSSKKSALYLGIATDTKNYASSL